MQNKWILPVVIGLVLLAIVAALLYMRDDSDTNASTGTAFRLSELGVEIQQPESISDLAYDVEETAGGDVLHMNTADIEADEEGTCELGTFFKIAKSDVAKQSTWTKSALDAARFEREGAPPQVMEFTGFYLVFEPSQARCSESAELERTGIEKREALWRALTSARFIQY